jgi:MFS family permease
MTSQVPPRPGAFSQTVRALGSRNFRLFYSGQAVSLVGTWIQQIAMSWLVYRLTGSAFMLGIVGFVGQIPGVFITPFGGVAADRWNRHRLVIFTQTCAMLQAFALAALTLSGAVRVWHILVLSAFVGIVNGLDVPARQSLLGELVERKEDIGNAIALNSTTFNAARLVGPAVAGFLIALVGEGVCFLLNGISFFAVLAALLAMRFPRRPARAPGARVLAQLGEGVRYALGFPPMRAVLLFLALVSFIAQPYMVLMPVVATRVLHGDAHTLGTLMAATGLGALAGAIYLASRSTVVGLGRALLAGAFLFGGALVGFGFSRSIWLSFPLLALAGVGMMVHTAASNTILQTIAADGMRGRIISLYSLAFQGTAPLGSLYAGSLAARAGAPVTIVIGGVVTLVASLYFATRLAVLREQVMPVYRRLGIVPEVAAGPENATPR